MKHKLNDEIEGFMKIANLNFKNNIFLAPMAGVADLTFREICQNYGCGAVYSEMVSAKGLYYNDKKTEKLLFRGNIKIPYIVQIFGSEPEIIAKVSKRASSYGDILDINMGCPTPKIVNNGDGSALLKNPDLAFSVAEAAVKNTDVPVTVKIRTGWDENNINAIKIAKGLENCGVSAIAIHGRTRNQFYSGVADWDIIREVKESINIPVIGNGDIFSPDDAVRMFKETNCDAVMVGRGSQGNPFIFKQINEMCSHGKVSFFPSPQDYIKQSIKHINSLVLMHGEFTGVKEARKHIAWYLKGLKNSSTLKTAIFKMNTLLEIETALNDFLEQFK